MRDVGEGASACAGDLQYHIVVVVEVTSRGSRVIGCRSDAVAVGRS